MGQRKRENERKKSQHFFQEQKEKGEERTKPFEFPLSVLEVFVNLSWRR
jgi:hypothetical protein